MYGIKDAREQTRNKKQMFKYRERERADDEFDLKKRSHYLISLVQKGSSRISSYKHFFFLLLFRSMNRKKKTVLLIFHTVFIVLIRLQSPTTSLHFINSTGMPHPFVFR